MQEGLVRMVEDKVVVRKHSTLEARLNLFEDLLKFMAEIYLSTNGKYPAMEWLPPEKKPNPHAENFFDDFAKKYGPFLKWRLTRELDEIILAFIDNEIVGVIALNYDLRGKKVPWIPKEFSKRNDIGFIELFAVNPGYRGIGIGSFLFRKAIERLRELGKKPCVVTFPNLEAVKFYEKMGGKIIKRYDVFVMYCFEKTSNL